MVKNGFAQKRYWPLWEGLRATFGQFWARFDPLSVSKSLTLALYGASLSTTRPIRLVGYSIHACGEQKLELERGTD